RRGHQCSTSCGLFVYDCVFYVSYNKF
ncbi:hypothetical protein D039_0011B, partial [Vibrio parahaemolyticus EKP-028]